MNRRLAATAGTGADQYDFPLWLRTTWPLLVIAACEFTLQSADVLIVSHYMTPTDVGIYFAAAKTMSLILFVHYAVGSAAANRFAALSARGDRDGLDICARGRALDLLAVAGRGRRAPAARRAAAVAVRPAVRRRLSGDADPRRRLPVPRVDGTVGVPVEHAGKQSMSAAVQVTVAVLSVVLNILLVPRYGLIGAATATSAALMTGALLNNVV